MNLLNKLTIKNLILNKKRTIVTIMGIILSVALITAVSSMYASGISSLINFEINRSGNYHAHFKNVPASSLATFKNNLGVSKILITKDLGYASINSENPDKPYAFIKAYTKDSLDNLSVNLTEGRLPENESEIIIPTHLKTNGRLELKVGDTITLNVGERISSDGAILKQNNPFRNDPESELSEKIINPTRKTYKIVGIMNRPPSTVESYSAPGYTFITYLTPENITNDLDLFVQYTKKGLKNAYGITANLLNVDEDLFVKVNKNSNITEEDYDNYVLMMEKAKYPVNLNTYLIGLETNPLNPTSITGLGTVVLIVLAIIVFTSVFCIKNSFNISITEKIKQYGMLKSIGATKKQIRKNVFYEATILGLFGIPLGILFGFLASYILIIISNYFLKDFIIGGGLLIFKFSYLALIVAIILGIITVYTSAIKSAHQASLVTPIDSIRNSNNIKINPKQLKTPNIITKLFGIGGTISYKNLKRNKKKYRTTVISLVVSVFVFIALSSFMNLAFIAVDEEVKLSDYNLSIFIDEKDLAPQKITEATSLDNIDNYSILRNNGFLIPKANHSKEYLDWYEVENYKEAYIDVYSIGDTQYKKYLKTLGLDYNETKNKGILIENYKASKYNSQTKKTISKYFHIYAYKKGDTINDLEVAKVTSTPPFGFKNRQSSYLIVSDEYFNQNFTTNSIQIVYKSSNASKVQDELDNLFKGEDYSIENIEENVRMMNSLYTLIGIFLYGFIIVVTLIGITNIFNTITTNMELRRQEFAMLKSIGMTKKEFTHMIRLESIFMGIKALFFGLIIGIALSYLIYYALGKELGISYKLPIMAILIAVIAVFLLISLIMKYSMNKINKQNTIETIRNENI